MASIIKGGGLYQHSVGEFFLLYGRFIEKYDLKDDKQIKAKMKALINEDGAYLKPYVRRGKSSPLPLPFAVRQTLAHPSPGNWLEKGELETSIDLLRSWVDTGSP